MKRPVAALLAVLVLAQTFVPAADAFAQAADAFPQVPLETPDRGSHWGAYGTMVAGVALIGVSFAFQQSADDKYDEYLTATDPERIDQLYDDTVRQDRLSSGALIGGELLLAAGLYLRFLRRPSDSAVSFRLAPDRCAISLRY